MSHPALLVKSARREASAPAVSTVLYRTTSSQILVSSQSLLVFVPVPQPAKRQELGDLLEHGCSLLSGVRPVQHHGAGSSAIALDRFEPGFSPANSAR